MSSLELFAFVILPLGVTVFGAAMAGAGVWLINRASEVTAGGRASVSFGQSYSFTMTPGNALMWAVRDKKDEREPDLFDEGIRYKH